MPKRLVRAFIGASIAAAALGAAAPAKADPLASTIWHNYAGENFSAPPPYTSDLVLGVAASNMTHGTSLIPWTVSGRSDQVWTGVGYPGWPGYDQFWTHGTANPDIECTALANNGNTADNTQGIIWECSVATPDQAWKLNYANFTDIRGAKCYSFQNLKALNQTGANKVLAIGPSATLQTGTNVLLETFTGTSRQYWCSYDSAGNPKTN